MERERRNSREKRSRKEMDEPSSSDMSPVGSPAVEMRDPLSSPARVEPPDHKEAWDEFINRYAMGEYHRSRATFRGAESPPTIDQIVASTQALHLDPPPPIEVERPTLLPHTSSSMDTQSSESTALAPSPDENPTPLDSSTPVPDPQSHPSARARGSNQDPDIPNIPEDQLATGEEHLEDSLRHSSAEEFSPQQELTRKNMGQLSRELEHAQAEADDEGEAGPSTRRRRESRRQRRSQVALMPEADEQGSSSDVEEGNKVQPSPRPSLRSYGSSRKPRIPRESYVPSLDDTMDPLMFDSGTNTTSSISHAEMIVDHIAQRARIREFYEEHGYLPAPQQPIDAMRRRLRVIRRFGLDRPTKQHRKVLSRFTRLAVSIFKTTGAHVSIIAKDKQLILAEIGLSGAKETVLDVAYCTHTIIGQGECMVIPSSEEDWRFKKNPFSKSMGGPINFYAGAPLRVGVGSKAAIIGSMCIFDERRRELTPEEKRLLSDLADCAVSELELLYSQQASVESAKLHQISVDFLRRSLKNRPNETAGSGKLKKGDTTSGTSGEKRKEGADRHQSEDEIDIYDEACSEIRVALNAFAVAAVDLSQFHLFYPTYQNSSVAGSSSRGASTSHGHTPLGHGSLSVSSDPVKKSKNSLAPPSGASKTTNSDQEGFGKNANAKKAASTYITNDPMAPARTPQVLFIPSRTTVPGKVRDENLAVLGYSCLHDGFAFNFSSSPVARRIISDFIASNVKTRRVWYTRDDSEGIAQSINHLMPSGTETSLAMPVFDFDGQVSFAIVACWKDPLYTYPAGALQFVETIAGSLLASVMKGKLYQAERAQLNFASAASHELRTPLHQINAAASLLRGSLHGALISEMISHNSHPTSPAMSPVSDRRDSNGMSIEDRVEALAQLEIIEANGLALSHILENIIDTLDIGRSLTSKAEDPLQTAGALTPSSPTKTWHLGDTLEEVVNDAVELESKTRRIAGGDGMNDVEIILEVLPRPRGRWLLASDPGPLSRALSKIIHNSCKFTDKGYIHITVQDTTRQVALPAGYDNSIRMSTVSIDIKDSGKGMTSEFMDGEILRPFSKADPFMPGSGLGLGLAQRIIELLGGKLAINSKIGKGTLVHIEVPLHLLNNDNEADQEDIEDSSSGPKPIRVSTDVRTDGIYLAGFESADPGVRRVGRSLIRQLKLRYCRIVENIHFASLIVVSKGALTDEQVADLAQNARPDVEVIYLDKAASSPHVSLLPTPSPAKSQALDYLATIPVTHLSRPLRPSILRRIFKAPPQQAHAEETYVSDVVGGAEMVHVRSHDSLSAEEILPSPASNSPPLPPTIVYPMSSSGPDSPTWTSPGSSPSVPPTVSLPHGDSTEAGTEVAAASVASGSTVGAKVDHIVPPNRPDLNETASDPLPAVQSIGERPALKDIKSEFHVQDESAGQLKVLVVEDNAVNRKILTTMLKRTSCKFAEAVDGAEAVAVFLSFAPDLVLLDINMPIKDGFQAAAEMRAIESSQCRKACRIIAVTALSSEAHRRKGLVESGISEWRTKPVAIKELRDEVERMKITPEDTRVAVVG